MKNKAIEKAISFAGSQKKLAELCGASQPTVWRWLHGGGIENRYILRIVKATGGQVSLAELNPELADLLKAS